MSGLESASFQLHHLFRRLSRGVKPWAKKVYFSVHPKKSWVEYQRMRAKYELLNDIWFSNLIEPSKLEQSNKSYRDAFFESTDEYESYVKELHESDIPERLQSAEEELPNRYEVYDVNKYTCERYYAYVRKYQPDVVVETGVHNGVSTLALLHALRLNGSGTLYSISRPDEGDARSPVNFDPENGGYDYSNTTPSARGRPSGAEPGSYAVPDGKEIGWVIPSEYRDEWNHYVGTPARVLPSVLDDVGEMDVFLHDSWHSISEMLFEFTLAWEWLNDDGVLFSHHIAWNEAFSTFVTEHECEFGLVALHLTKDHYPRNSVPGCAGFILKPH